MKDINKSKPLSLGIWWAVFSALLFGLVTPISKLFLSYVNPIGLAGLFYLGSGIGLGIIYLGNRIFRSDDNTSEILFTKHNLPWLAGAILAGGVAAPILLMTGINLSTASSSSLMLNMESVFTIIIASLLFNERLEKKGLVGIGIIILGGILLSWPEKMEFGSLQGPIFIAFACLAWGIDNNLTRQLSAGDPVQIASIKGMSAGITNIVLSFIVGLSFPSIAVASGIAAVGLLGYGFSIVFFIISLRHLGSARTSAFFSVAPFIGALASFLILGEPLTLKFTGSFIFMGIGIYLLFLEKHQHVHIHDTLTHSHLHEHDEHHKHAHPDEVENDTKHSHEHIHENLMHSHPHYPDIHHRHIH